MASISSVIFIVPSCAANAEPRAAGDHDRGHQRGELAHAEAPIRLIV
jgi:hypothetical protein